MDQAIDTPRWRILIVDDEAQTRQDHLRSLDDEGYELFVAIGQGQDLLADARDLARKHRCHLAVVDMRLLDGSDRTDTSGLDLVEKLKPAESIVVTGYADKALYVETAHAKGARHILDKDAGPEALRAMVRTTLEECGYRKILIKWPEEWSELRIARHLFPENPGLFREEADDVLRRLFPEARQLDITPIDTPSDSLSLTLRPGSLVMRIAKDGERLHYFVKIGRGRRTKQEKANFERVHRDFEDQSPVKPLTAVELWDLGGIVYEYAGNFVRLQPHMFSDWYKAPGRTVDQIDEALQRVYEQWELHYHRQTGQSGVVRAYNEVWDRDKDADKKWLVRLVSGRDSLAGVGFPPPLAALDLPHPVDWLIAKLAITPQGGYIDPRTPAIGLATTHGDLHGDNFFVTTARDVWVIDYERTGEGHVLQDWIELEHDILTRLTLCEPEEWCRFARLVCAIARPHYVEKWPKSGEQQPVRLEHPQLDLALAVIGRIRDYAKRSADDSVDGRAYIWGLLLNAIFRLMIWQREYAEPALIQEKRQDIARRRKKLLYGIRRCYVLAGLLCHRLDNWNAEWPPQAWSAVLSGSTTLENVVETGRQLQRSRQEPSKPLGPHPNRKRGKVDESAKAPRRTRHVPFKLFISHASPRRNAKTLRIQALETPNGQVDETGRLPYTEAELAAVTKALEFGYALDLGYWNTFDPACFTVDELAVLRRHGLLDEGGLAADYRKKIGQKLYQALLPGKAGSAFDAAAETARQQRATVAMQLRMGENSTLLARHPWELLHDGRQHLLATGKVELTRYIAYGEGATRIDRRPPFKMLYIEARPRNDPRWPLLPADAEREAVTQALQPLIDAGRLQFYKLTPPTFDEFQKQRDLIDDIDILHFDGHGVYGKYCARCQSIAPAHLDACPRCGASVRQAEASGFLIFQGADDNGKAIAAKHLAAEMSRSRCGLAFLSACQSAEVRGDSVFGGVAPGLIQAGLPAVVGMQFPGAVRHTALFAEAFYTTLAGASRLTGQAISDAVFKGRRRLFENDAWHIIALYLREQAW